jgi:hypothetical protein
MDNSSCIAATCRHILPDVSCSGAFLPRNIWTYL